MKDLCAISYGPTQMTVAGGEFLLEVLVTHSARTFQKRLIITMG